MSWILAITQGLIANIKSPTGLKPNVAKPEPDPRPMPKAPSPTQALKLWARSSCTIFYLVILSLNFGDTAGMALTPKPETYQVIKMTLLEQFRENNF